MSIHLFISKLQSSNKLYLLQAHHVQNFEPLLAFCFDNLIHPYF